jgi:hypothetical protein
MRRVLTCASAMLVAALLPAHAQEVLPARIAVLSPNALALYGQEGYCGSMDTYAKENKEGVLIPSNKRTWFRLRSNSCFGDFSFVPKPGSRYVLQVTTCSVRLFELHAGQRPTSEPLQEEEKRSCLLPWNHGTKEETPRTENVQ